MAQILGHIFFGFNTYKLHVQHSRLLLTKKGPRNDTRSSTKTIHYIDELVTNYNIDDLHHQNCIYIYNSVAELLSCTSLNFPRLDGLRQWGFERQGQWFTYSGRWDAETEYAVIEWVQAATSSAYSIRSSSSVSATET